jgi:hypothetical protein
MLVFKDFYDDIKKMRDCNLGTLELYAIISSYIADGQIDKIRRGKYIEDDKYFSLLSNTLFAIRYFDDEIGKIYRDIILEILKEL